MQLLAAVVTVFLLQQAPAVRPMDALTVPSDRLPVGCALAPSATQKLEGGTVRAGLWAGLPIPTNPWAGDDAAIVATIRERIEPPARMPDGPPMTQRELAQWRLRLAEGVTAAYAAVYVNADDQLVTVYALKFAKNTELVTRVLGPSGECRDAIVAHLDTVVP